MKKGIFTILIGLLMFGFSGHAQFTTPTVDGVISTNEYGDHTNGSNQLPNGGQTWYMTWDNSKLYVGVSGYNNANDAVVLYLDVDPIKPVNGGANANGTLSGTNYDNVNPVLPFRADFFAFVKPGYDDYKSSDGSGGWGTSTTGNVTKASGSGVIEFEISWSSITGSGRPSSFNWLGFLSYDGGGGGLFAQVPTENPAGNTPGMIRYFTVTSTNDASSTKPFSQNSYTHIGGNITGFGGIDIFDLTMNTNGATITRASGNGGVWKISNDLIISDGTISFGSSEDKVDVGGDLWIDTNGTLTLSSAIGGDIEVTGDFEHSGTFTHNTRLVTFNGSATQTIGGKATTAFGFLTVAADAMVEVPASKNITIDNNFVVEASKNSKAAGQFTLKSDATGTASLITTGTISGDIKAERFLTGGWNWHFLSSPVVDQPIVGADNFIDFSFGTNNDEGDPNVDFYRFDETNTNNLPWINIKDGDGTLNESFGTPSNDPLFETGLGYLVAYNGGELTKTFSGEPFNVDLTVDLTHTTTGSLGWNLVGNPYASAIDWDNAGVVKSNLQTAAYYIFNENKTGGAGYEWYINSTTNSSGASGKIPAMQAFFVKAGNVASPKLDIGVAARVHDDQPFLKESPENENQLLLKIQHGQFYDHTLIILSENSTTGVDFYDAFMLYSLNGNVPHIYTLAGEEKLISNSVPFPDEDYSIPMGLKTGAAGTYTITAEDIQNFNSSVAPILEDTQTGAEIDLRFESSYTFDIAEPGIHHSRFILHLKSTVGINAPNQKPQLAVTQIGSALHFYNLEPGDYQLRIVDVMGRVVMEEKLNAEKAIALPGNIQAGHYIIQLVGKQTYQNNKILIY